MTIWHLDVDRVRITGVSARRVDVTTLGPIVEQAVRTALATATLPAGRAVHASVQLRVPTLSNSSAIAGAVARGVASAARGRGYG